MTSSGRLARCAIRCTDPHHKHMKAKGPRRSRDTHRCLRDTAMARLDLSRRQERRATLNARHLRQLFGGSEPHRVKLVQAGELRRIDRTIGQRIQKVGNFRDQATAGFVFFVVLLG